MCDGSRFVFQVQPTSDWLETNEEAVEELLVLIVNMSLLCESTENKFRETLTRVPVVADIEYDHCNSVLVVLLYRHYHM